MCRYNRQLSDIITNFDLKYQLPWQAMSIIAQVNLRCVLLSTLDDVNRGLSSEIDAYGYLSL
jgi:hypothetical protein